MKKILLSFFFTALSLFATDGQSLSAKCVACHGAFFEKSALGKSAVIYGQSASDIYGKLIGYKQGTRNENGMGALMKGQVATMSNNDLWAIAEYVASLEIEATTEAAPAATEEVAPAAEATPANDWPFVCEQPYIKGFADNRYFQVSSSDDFPLILADSQTINIDRKKKTIKVWTAQLGSEKIRQEYINDYGSKFSDFGYVRYLNIIDYQSMRHSTISFAEYKCDGSIIESGTLSGKWQDIVPDSVMEGKMKSIMTKYNLK